MPPIPNGVCIILNLSASNLDLRSSARVGRDHKRHLTDLAPSISVSVSIESMLLNDLNTSGFMFEAMSESDLRIHAHADGGEPYHYRDG